MANKILFFLVQRVVKGRKLIGSQMIKKTSELTSLASLALNLTLKAQYGDSVKCIILSTLLDT